MASCLLSAVSFWSKPSKKELAPVEEAPAPAIVEIVAESPVEEAPAVAEPSQDLQQLQELESALDAMSKKLESLQSEVDSTKVVTSSKKDELDNLVGAIASDVEIVIADLEEKEAIIAELAEANASQADQIAYIQGRYDKEVSTKFFANVGGVIGFKELLPTWGVTGNFGIRFGHGLMVGSGVQYMIGDFQEKPDLDWSLDRLSVNFTVGWEW